MSNKHQRLLGSGGAEARNDNDYYPTPPFVTHALVRKFKDSIPNKVWEPAAGRGWMAEELIRCGYTVRASELFEYQDPLCDIEWGVNFLTPNVSLRNADAIITNPPYEKKVPQEFAQKALDTEATFVAMLCRLLWVEASGRYEFFTKNPPSDILQLAGRFSCQEKKFAVDPLGGMVAYAWFVWDKSADHYGEFTKFHWTECSKELELWKAETATTIESFIE